MDPLVRDLAILIMLAMFFVLTLYVLSLGWARQRDLEERLGKARTEITTLRANLAEATQPPTQFARMRMREGAVNRFARLRLAAPRRARLVEAERLRDRSH